MSSAIHSINEIAEAIKALPPRERLRLVERVLHDITAEPSAVPDSEEGEAVLVEHAGVLVVAGEGELPLDLFDHRIDREDRIARFSGIR